MAEGSSPKQDDPTTQKKGGADAERFPFKKKVREKGGKKKRKKKKKVKKRKRRDPHGEKFLLPKKGGFFHGKSRGPTKTLGLFLSGASACCVSSEERSRRRGGTPSLQSRAVWVCQDRHEGKFLRRALEGNGTTKRSPSLTGE